MGALALGCILLGQLPQPTAADDARAGHPQQIARHAQPSYAKGAVHYWVGGGAASGRRMAPRAEAQGIWGLDHGGSIFRKRVALGWWNGAKRQGGVGKYNPDGFHVPDIPNAIRPLPKPPAEDH